jgi:hypothetical protein
VGRLRRLIDHHLGERCPRVAGCQPRAIPETAIPPDIERAENEDAAG